CARSPYPTLFRSRLLRLAREAEDAPRVAEQQLARARRGGAAPEPVEQLHAQLVLERAHVLGDGGLREVERLGGAREAAELGDLGEDLEAAQVHQQRRALAGPSWNS